MTSRRATGKRASAANQWCRGKSFDTFAPLGPAIVTRDEIPDPQNLTLKAGSTGISANAPARRTRSSAWLI
jgi:2-keto-4-pentenoate hydratase/2-oxohepta-3-ene-1,7-dioic acid hydratase in catechol pathway